MTAHFGGKKDRIELACTMLTKQIGDARCDKLKKALRGAAGDSVAGATMLSIIQPGLLSTKGHDALTEVFTGLL